MQKAVAIMDINYLGHSSFRIKGKIASIVTDPFDSEMVGFKFPSVEADIVTVSHNHKDHNKTGVVGGDFKVINGAGEYEIKDVSILGFSSWHDSKKGELRGKNTIYVFEIDGLRVCHLGDLGHKLSESDLENIGDIDVLMVPVGGTYTLNGEESAQLVRDVEPQVVIPMHYKLEGINQDNFSKLEEVEKFLKEVGLPVEKMAKLSLKKEDVELSGQRIVVLERK